MVFYPDVVENNLLSCQKVDLLGHFRGLGLIVKYKLLGQRPLGYRGHIYLLKSQS